MKKIFVMTFIVVIALSVILLSGCNTSGTTRYNTNILTGGEGNTFNYETLSDMQEDWTLTTNGSASEAFSIVDNGSSPNYIKINTTTKGYATLSQTLYLRSYSYYKVSYKYTSSSMAAFSDSANYIGLIVGFEENPSFNLMDDKPTEERSSNSDGTAFYYFKTGNIKEVNVQIHVGTEDNPVSTTNVTLKDMSIERVTKSEAMDGKVAVGYYELTSAIYNRPSVLNIAYVCVGAVVTLLIAYLFYMLRARNIALESSTSPHKLYTKFKESKVLPIATVVFAVLFVRLMITLIQSLIAGGDSIYKVYYSYETQNLGEVGVWLANYAPTYFFEYFPGQQTLPFAYYISLVAGLFGRLIGLGNGVSEETILLTTVTMIKLFAILADVGTALVIYNIIKSKYGKVGATIMASMYALMPVLFVTSAYIGAMDSITIFFITLTFYYILRKNYIGMSIAYFAACMVTPSALIVSPFILMYTIYLIVMSVKEKNKFWIKPAIVIPSSLILYFLISLPFFFTLVQKGKVLAGFNNYIAVVRGGGVYTANAFNFQGMLGNNFGVVSTASIFVTILFIGFIGALLGIAYFKSKNRLSLIMLSASFVFIYWYFCNNMKPNTILIMLPLLFIYTAIVGDKRLYALFSMIASFAFINTSYLYMVATYSETGAPQLDYSNPIMYIMGAFYLVLILAYVIIGYDTLITKRAKPHLVLVVSYGEYLKSVLTNMLINIKNFGYKTQGILQAIGLSIKEKFADDGAIKTFGNSVKEKFKRNKDK